MEMAEYFERTLDKYAGAFDIYRNYSINQRQYPAYGYFFSLGEKYVLSRKANLWSIRSYEHVLFLQEETVTGKLLDELDSVLTEHMEPQMVRKGEKYPEKDHMYSYLTFVILCRKSPAQEVIRRIGHYRYERSYLMNFRGHSEGHLICVDLEQEKVYTNRAASGMKKMFEKTFRDNRKSRIGNADAFEQVG